MTRTRVNSIELEYTVSSDGPAVLLSHGYSDTGRAWDGQRQAMSGYRVITWDMRGHGETESPEDPAAYSLDLTIADMRALLQHVGVERAVVGGLSLGGYVSLAFALAHPEMVRALIICDSGPGYRNAEARAAWNARAHDRAAKLETSGLAAVGRSRAARGTRVRSRARARPRQGRPRPPWRTARTCRGIAPPRASLTPRAACSPRPAPQVIDGLPSIAVPTLIIVGDQDEPFLAPSAYMAKKIPGARLEIIPGAGHWTNIDQPALFDRIVLDFLASLPPA